MVFESVKGEGPEEKDGKRAARRVHPTGLEELGLNFLVDQGGDAQDEVKGK